MPSGWRVPPSLSLFVAQTSGENCPNIFYREPLTSRTSAPEGCPPAEYQQLLRGSERGDLGVGDSDQADTLEELQTTSPAVVTPGSTAVPTSPPLPADRSDVIAFASPIDSQLAISLMNDTGATVTYEVVGDTQRRTLMMGESAMLQDIALPTTITVVRPDNGLLNISASSSEAGMLEISITPEASLDDTQGVIRMQEDGQVFVN